MTKVCIICNQTFISPRKARGCSLSCRVILANKQRRVQKSIWAKENKESVDASKKRWLEKYPEKRKQASSEYRQRNMPYYTNYSSLRSRRIRQACPKWADNNLILDVCKEASYFQLEVDPIIPIKHPLVCGLHVWNNLQLLSREANARKSNKFEILDEDILGVFE